MFRRKEPENAALDKVIDALLQDMSITSTDTKEYATLLGHLVTLQKLKETNSPKPISRDTILVVAGNLAGIVLILAYENSRVITSKALGFVLKAVR